MERRARLLGLDLSDVMRSQLVLDGQIAHRITGSDTEPAVRIESDDSVMVELLEIFTEIGLLPKPPEDIADATLDEVRHTPPDAASSSVSGI